LVTGVQTCALPICRVEGSIFALRRVRGLALVFGCHLSIEDSDLVGTVDFRPLRWDLPCAHFFARHSKLRSVLPANLQTWPTDACPSSTFRIEIGRASCRERL